MKFTNNEWEIVKHRLESDCTAETLTDDIDITTIPGMFMYNKIVDRLATINQHNLDLSVFVDRAIIEDCCNSCTFFADIDDAVRRGELSRGKKLAYFRAAQSVEEKTGYSVITY